MLNIIFALLKLNYAFTFGILIEDELQIYKTPEKNMLYFSEFEIEINISDYFFINNKLQVNFQEIRFFRVYDPYQFRFDINIGLRYKFIEIGFHHFCIHPMKTYYIRKYPDINYEGGREELYLKFKGEIK